MQNSSERLRYLFGLYQQNTATAEERSELMHLIKAASNETVLKELIDEEISTIEVTAGISDPYATEVLARILESGKPAGRLHFLNRAWLRYAALLLIFLGAGFYFWNSQNGSQKPFDHPELAQANILPGSTGAILTLENGTQVILDSLKTGVVATQNGARLMYGSGQLAYDPAQLMSHEITYNTIATPRGRQFMVTLSDGTRAWLNADSRLTYPTAFTGDQRIVEVTGEAYFEVSRNPEKPFRVIVNQGLEVEVLGTRFNIQAYPDERSMNTTLLEGSVRLSVAHGNRLLNKKTPLRNEAVILKPGQQGQVSNQSVLSGISVTDQVNESYVLAWKNGLFNFQDKKLDEVMRQIARWYNIEIVYPAGVPDIEFGGEMGRNEPLSNVLLFLRKAGIQFKIDDVNRVLEVKP